MHTDCCSTSCLSYSYKCVERHHGPEEYDVVVAETTVADKAEPTTINEIDELVERFDGSDDVTTTNTYQTHPNQTQPSTVFPVQTDQPVTQISNDIGHNDSNCRSNGSLV